MTNLAHKAFKVSKVIKASKAIKVFKVCRVSRERKEFKAHKVHRVFKVVKASKVCRVSKALRVFKEFKEIKAYRVIKDVKVNKVCKANKAHKDSRVFKVIKAFRVHKVSLVKQEVAQQAASNIAFNLQAAKTDLLTIAIQAQDFSDLTMLAFLMLRKSLLIQVMNSKFAMMISSICLTIALVITRAFLKLKITTIKNNSHCGELQA